MAFKDPDSSTPAPQHPNSPALLIRRVGAALVLAVFLSSCSTPALNAGRGHFYRGQLAQADEALSDPTRMSEKDKALFLMERGTVRQMEGKYEDSSQDYIAAYDELRRLETYSLSKGGASLVINDGVQSYIGTPAERTLLHAFTAKNHLASANWDNAAVEARRILLALDPAVKGEYPEDAYSRYVAGVCLEMIDDPSNASVQYRLANDILRDVEINEFTGYLRPKTWRQRLTNAAPESAEARESPKAHDGPGAPPPWPPERFDNELVCFVLLGRGPGSMLAAEGGLRGAPKAEVYHQGRLLGPCYALGDTVDLAYRTAEKQAAAQALKDVTRVGLKVVAVEAIAHNTENDALASLVAMILLGILEQPDVRRWETLPRWLMVARVPCPPDLDEYDVVIKNARGQTVQTIHVTDPIRRRKNIFVSFCRDLPIPSTLPPLPPKPAETP